MCCIASCSCHKTSCPLQAERSKEFKEKFVAYLESLMHMQQEVSVVDIYIMSVYLAVITPSPPPPPPSS